MTQRCFIRARGRRRELATSIAAAWMLGGFVSSLYAATDRFGATSSPMVSPDQRTHAQSPAAQTRLVMSCSDDPQDSTNLRAVVTGMANSGDIVDLSQLPSVCGPNALVTLSHGEITINVDDLTLRGPGSGGTVTISGNGASRVFKHIASGPGNAKLKIDHLAVREGKLAPATGSALGGCIYSNSDVELDASQVVGCTAYSVDGAAKGGGVAALGDVVLVTSTIDSNFAKEAVGAAFPVLGGGIYGGGRVTAACSTVASNQAINGSWSYGGGVFSAGSALMVASTFRGNSAEFGGGTTVFASSSFVNSTFFNNVADRDGGAILAAAPLIIANSTIAQNSASVRGAGVMTQGAIALELQSAILAQNPIIGMNTNADLDMSQGGALSGSDNLVVSPVGVTLPNPAITRQDDPQFGSCGFHGGLVETCALRRGSPAIGIGNNVFGWTTDARGRGYPRSTTSAMGATTDMGSYEYDSIFAHDLDP